MSEEDGPEKPATGEAGKSPWVSVTLQMELDRCRTPLRDFAAAPDGHPGFAYSGLIAVRMPVEPDRLPVIASLPLIMRLLVGARNLGRADKLAWEYPFMFRGRACSLALMKFGLRLYLEPRDDADDAADAREIVSKLAAASRLLEKNLLRSLVETQVGQNRIIVHNQMGQLRGIYQYFRDLAREAYAGNGLLAKRFDEQHKDSIFLQGFRSLPEQQEGFFATVAMITAYFSLLEHLFVFALAMTDFDPARDSLKEFIGLRLLEKYKRIFDLTRDQMAHSYYDRLHDVAEKWRNPYDHGGFDKKGGALSISLPAGLGVIPLILSDIRTHPTFHFMPERETSFDEVTALFDEIDAWLRQSYVGPGIAWAEAGLNISFEPERLDDIRQAVAAGKFGELLTKVSYIADRATNMDW
jgi:hypothetical protein